MLINIGKNLKDMANTNKSKFVRKTPKITKEDMLSFWRNFNDKHLQDVLLVRWMNELVKDNNNKEV